MRLPRSRSVAAAVLAMTAACASIPASADGAGDLGHRPKFIPSEGCIALGTHIVQAGSIRPWDCTYRATGPSVYVAATGNPFVIAASRDNGKTWIVLERRSRLGPPTSGTVKTKGGDLVSVSITCWNAVTSGPCGRDADLGGRDGMIVANSEI